ILRELVEHPFFEPDGITPRWTSPMTSFAMGMATWLLHDSLSVETRDLVRGYLIDKANHWAAQAPKDSYITDTGAEENSWRAELLALTGLLYSDDPASPSWLAKAETYAYHTLTVPPDPPFGGYDTQTLHPGYLLENHGWLPHLSYLMAASVGPLGQGAALFSKRGLSVPNGFSHNVALAWGAHEPYLDPSTFLLRDCGMANTYGGKDDWGNDGTSFDSGFAYLDNLQGTSWLDAVSEFHFRIRYGLNFFPRDAPVPIYGGRPRYSFVMRRFMNSVSAFRHAMALLQKDPSLTLPTP
ncbi:hypothetical protein ACFL6C_14490, partial [Myxococcota bacterium]